MTDDEDVARSDVAASSKNAAREIAEATRLTALKKHYEPISLPQLIEQEGLLLSRRDLERKLKLGALPRQIQALVTGGQLSLMVAEELSRARLESHEKVALAGRLTANGGGGAHPRRVVREMLKLVQQWPSGERASFLADPSRSFEEAREEHKQQDRDRREAEQQKAAAHNRTRRLRRVGIGSVESFVDGFLSAIKLVQERPMDPTLVDPLTRRYTIDRLRDALEENVLALVAMGEGRAVKHDLEMLLATVFTKATASLEDPNVIQIHSSVRDAEAPAQGS
jgi:hypothetical protein